MKSSYLLSLAIAVIAGLWIASAIFFPPSQAEPPDAISERVTDPEEDIIDVRVRDSVAEEIIDLAVVTGRTQANRTVSLAAEIDARVDEILVEEGALVEEGEILARLAVEDRAARVSQAKETLRQREIEFNAAQSLERRGFNSEIRLAETRANLETARADLKLAEKALNNTEITAPFAGMVGVQMVETGDFANKGQELFEMVELDPIEFVAFVTERIVSGLSTGKPVQAEFLNGETMMGQLTYIAPAANEETRTFRIEVEASNPDYLIRDGLTAELRIPLREKPAHRLPASILTLDDDGILGVKILENGVVARFMPVSVVRTAGDDILVTGLPERITYIEVGAEFTADGGLVNPVYSSDVAAQSAQVNEPSEAQP